MFNVFYSCVSLILKSIHKAYISYVDIDRFMSLKQALLTQSLLQMNEKYQYLLN